MKIFNTIFGRTVPGEIIPEKNEEIDKLRDVIDELGDKLKELRDKKDKLEKETIPELVKEYPFTTKEYFLPDAEFRKHVFNKREEYVQHLYDKSTIGKLRCEIEHLQYLIYYNEMYISYTDIAIYGLPGIIRENKLVELNKRYCKFKDGKKNKYTKYEIKRKRL